MCAMRIKRKRIRKIEPYARMIPPGNDVLLGVLNPSGEDLLRIGFLPTAENGTTLLPAPVGPVSKFNAEGKDLVHKDQPMETAYRTIEWHWTEWHGRDRVEQSDFRDRPYQRYPRTFISPPAVELTLTTDADENRVVRTPVIHDWKRNKTDLLHAVNLLLELFGECCPQDSVPGTRLKAR